MTPMTALELYATLGELYAQHRKQQDELEQLRHQLSMLRQEGPSHAVPQEDDASREEEGQG